nr:MAG TPA: hypothetical protein [Caudoviricetes sp.]
MIASFYIKKTSWQKFIDITFIELISARIELNSSCYNSITLSIKVTSANA